MLQQVETQKREISDLAMIGDGKCAMLVDRAGAIAWGCWPRFDSPAPFASLLGDDDNGEWRIVPEESFNVSRQYQPDTLVLETRFETERGSVSLIDFMPFEGAQALVRRVRCRRGTVPMTSRFAPRAGFGRSAPKAWREDGRLRVAGEQLDLTLQSTRPELAKPDARIAFELSEGEAVDFVLSAPEDAPEDAGVFAAEAERRCAAFWRAWAVRCTYIGPWRAAVVRSLITLKALIYAPTGAMVAAPTSSLPEQMGGERNWDYRYCWLRDATFTIMAFLHAGYLEEAEAWVNWFVAATKANSGKLYPFYGVNGAEVIEEREADWLSGFDHSRPVRFGNGARRQLQLDVYGEAQDAIFQWRAAADRKGDFGWAQQVRMLNHLSGVLDQPDCGIWEQRSHREWFTQSRVLAWVAFDRVQRSAARFGLSAPSDWETKAAGLHEEICSRGYDPQLGAFTRAYGSKSLDASGLLIGLVGFLPACDPRLVGTLEAVRKNLGDGPFLRRYDTEREQDGMTGREGAFLPCSFWMADNLVLLGRRDEAAAIFEQVAGVANDVGLLSEEYDVSGRRLLGNFPQALTHLALVHTALNLTGDGPAHRRASSDY